MPAGNPQGYPPATDSGFMSQARRMNPSFQNPVAPTVAPIAQEDILPNQTQADVDALPGTRNAGVPEQPQGTLVGSPAGPQPNIPIAMGPGNLPPIPERKPSGSSAAQQMMAASNPNREEQVNRTNEAMEALATLRDSPDNETSGIRRILEQVLSDMTGGLVGRETPELAAANEAMQQGSILPDPMSVMPYLGVGRAGGLGRAIGKTSPMIQALSTPARAARPRANLGQIPTGTSTASANPFAGAAARPSFANLGGTAGSPAGGALPRTMPPLR